jgi:hypothetical protein
VLSCLWLLLSALASTSLVRRARSRAFATTFSEDAVEEDTSSETHAGIVEETKAHVRKHGGVTIFTFKLLRLASALALLALFVTTLVLEEEGEIHVKTTKHGKKHRKRYYVFTRAEWYQFVLAMTSVYASALSITSVVARPSIASRASTHAGWLLFAICCAYTYRDIWPLATFTLQPKDRKEGALMWAKLGASFVGGVLVPLFVPRQYIPVDPRDPAPVPNAEQTCSWFSLLMYTFLDGTIYEAYKLPSLPRDRLPPLADYDRAKTLVARSYPQLDTFSGAKKRHLFWGLMAVFRREYIVLTFLMIIRTVSGFMSPLGIRYLLGYLESGGEGAIVRPWVWVSWLFFGPFIGSLSIQYYVFINVSNLCHPIAMRLILHFRRVPLCL